MGKIFLVSLGCDKNRVDGETMVGTLRGARYDVIKDPSVADAIIVNTCGFIQDAVKESIDMILELAEFKQDKCRALIVVGCMAQRYKKEIIEAIPETDVIVGVGEYENIARVVADLIGSPQSGEKSATPHTRLAARHEAEAPHVAYVKISEGCDNHCTYCAIPSIRGPYRSRTMEDILDECRLLVSAGARELIFVAQDTALYGTDIYGEKKLPELLRKTSATSGADWIRLMYAYPEHITQELIETIANTPQVCKYIDMPIQHSEDTILSAMGRQGSRKELLTLIATLREKIPGIVIRTTLMVGFPGERVEDFRGLYDFAKKVKFDRLGVFPYSREEGTPAATLPKQVKQEVKQTRLDQIMALQQKIHFAKQESMVGQTVPVIVDEATDKEHIGRTQGDAYEVDSLVYFTASKPVTPGQIRLVRITGSREYDLRGVLDESEPSQ